MEKERRVGWLGWNEREGDVKTIWECGKKMTEIVKKT